MQAAYLLLGGGAACGVDATSVAFPGSWTVVDPAGAYSMKVQSPPWQAVAMSAQQVALAVPARLLNVTLGATSYSLIITHAEGDAAVLAASRADLLIAQGATLLVEPRSVTSQAGVAGSELIAEEPSGGIEERDVYFALAGGGVAQLVFQSIYDLQSQDIDVMVESFAATGP